MLYYVLYRHIGSTHESERNFQTFQAPYRHTFSMNYLHNISTQDSGNVCAFHVFQWIHNFTNDHCLIYTVCTAFVFLFVLTSIFICCSVYSCRSSYHRMAVLGREASVHWGYVHFKSNLPSSSSNNASHLALSATCHYRALLSRPKEPLAQDLRHREIAPSARPTQCRISNS
jgi:hypothetical protein